MSLGIQNIYQNNLKPVFKQRQASFGNSNSYDNDTIEQQNAPTRHALRNIVKAITGSFVSIIGFNAGLFYLQKFVNSKLLVGKINRHFTDKITDKTKLVN